MEPQQDQVETSTGHVKLVWITPDAQHMIAKCARVSNPSNQENRETEERLLKYLVKHQHWSPFEMAYLCLEIKTTRGISAQILRHRSFTFQEYSQRYATAQSFEMPRFRRQDNVNRQNSFDDVAEEKQAEIQQQVDAHLQASFELYDKLIANRFAKESARFVLPLCTSTTMYMCGSVRSWLHYIQVRGNEDTQKEHREIAVAAKKILTSLIPTLKSLLN